MKGFLAKHSVLLLILLAAVLLRLYKVNNPVLDWHSFRQADTASVTRQYVKHGIDLLQPRYHDLANIQSGMDNTDGYRMVEFPIINAIVALVVKAVPVLSLEVTHRVVSILFSILTLTFLFLLVKEVSGIKVAYATSIVFAVLPYNVFYSRAILPEPGVVMGLVGSLYFFYIWLKEKKLQWYVVSLVLVIWAILLKPFVLFFFPIFVVIAYQRFKRTILKQPLLYLYFLVSLLPVLWWRSWITHFPSGVPASEWLFDGMVTPHPHWLPHNKLTSLIHQLFGYNPEGLRYHPAWFRWLGYERLIKLFLGYTGVIFLATALYGLKKKELRILATSWFCIALYFTVIARGNVQHDYYQVMIIPFIAWTVGRGMVMAQSLLSRYFTHLLAFLVVVVIFFSSLLFSWKLVKGYYNINNPEYLVAGSAVDRLTPTTAKVIAPAFGDTMFLYQTNRTGWPIGYDIEEKVQLGATHYISTSYDDEARELEEKYFTIEKTPSYILIDLTRKKESL